MKNVQDLLLKKALTHLSESGVGDVAYFGPENEFLYLKM